MIKVFTLNKNGKIELTSIELEQLLNESYWEGYRDNHFWTYTSPSIDCNKNQRLNITTTPYTFATNTTSSSDSITIKTNQKN